jgi:transcriptional regulator with XRE-family HTH domain
MKVNPLVLTLRAKKVGALIRSARQESGKSLETCAGLLGVSVETFEAYELGEKSASLPELETLAYQLDLPLGVFLGEAPGEAAEPDGRRADPQSLENRAALRQRIIGAQLRKARQAAGLSLEELSEQAWNSPGLLEAYELGEMPIPLPDLEALSQILEMDLQDFQDQKGPAAVRAQQKQAVENFLSLPPALQAFVAKPVNQPYLRLAQRLSEMDGSRLRLIAEGLLEITL